MPVTIITGASAGLGRALARTLANLGWDLVIDARGSDALRRVQGELAERTNVVAIPGDVADPGHRREIAAAAAQLGRLDLLVNNASRLGPSPQPRIEDYPLDELSRVLDVNVIAPAAMIQLTLSLLTATAGVVVNITSDAAVEPYAGWGGYGSSKAALDQLTTIFAAEHPELGVYALDPGDMRTEMHRLAYPGEDISDRPPPESVVPAFLRLIETRPRNGRYRASDLLTGLEVPA